MADAGEKVHCGSCGIAAVNAGARFCRGCGAAMVLPPGSGAPATVKTPEAVAPADVLPAGLSASGARAVPVVRRGFWVRVQRGWELSMRCLELIRAQPGLVVVPVISSSAILVLLLLADVVGQALPGVLAFFWALLVLAALATLAVGGQAVIVHRVGTVLRGGSCTNGEALRAIAPKWRALAGWASVSLSVGVLIRSLESRRSVLGLVLRVVGFAAAVAWSALTFFMVPVIVFEDLGARAAFSRSRQLVRDNWGEGVVGVGVLTALLNVTFLGVLVLVVLFAAAHLMILAVLLLVAAIIAVNLLSAVASPVFVAVLYHYATAGQVGLGFSEEDMAAMFGPRSRVSAAR